MRTLLAAAFAALVLVTAARSADAQTASHPAASGTRTVPTYTIEQFMETVQLGRAFFSPGGEKLLFSSDASGVFNAYEVDVAGGEPVQLTRSSTDGINVEGYFPADARVLYSSDRGGNELSHLYVRDPDGTVRDLTPGENLRAVFHAWAPDGRAFFLLTNERDPRFMDLYEMSADTYERTLLYRNDRGLDVGAVSPDRRLLTLLSPVTNNDTDLLLHDLETGQTSRIGGVTPIALPGRTAFGPDGRSLYYVTNEGSEFAYLARYDPETGERTAVLRPEGDVFTASFSPDGRYLALAVNHEASLELRVFETGTLAPVSLAAPGHAYPFGPWAVFSRDGERIAFHGASGRSPADLYVLELGSGDVRKLTSTLNPAVDPYHLVEPELVRFASYDGLEIPGLLYRPHGATPDVRVPAVIQIPGGPGGQHVVVYRALTQYLVNQGYAVYEINNRGTAGSGRSFSAADDRRHGEADLGDVVASKRMLIETGWIDPGRIAVMGASYGGFLAMAALTFHPEEFAAGVDIFGVTNWIRTLENIPPWWKGRRDAIYGELGDPATDRDRLHRISPLFHADRITKPFIVLQGANDPRVLQVESDEIVAAARANGVPVEYVVFPDEGHGFRKKENQRRANEAIRLFLDRHLKEIADTVFVAPPTGVREADRASILAALEQVRPGGTVQFAPGTYLIGEIIPVPVSRITLLGHVEGTILRGCDPEEWASVQNPRASCNTLELLGSHQTVRDLTFEHMSLGLALGPATRRLAGLSTGDEDTLINRITGGHLIEGNTFRESSNGIRGDGRWSESILIRGNRFINTYHAVSLAGSHVHLLDNDISVPQPERVPPVGHPGLAVAIAGTNEHFRGGPFDCEHNVIAGNRIEGHPQGSLYLYALGGHCRHNVIRDNTIIVPATARFSGDPSEEAGVPLLLFVAPVGDRSVPNPEDRGSIEENVIEGNRVVGAEGLGMAIYGASRNRIANNTISGITRQERNLLALERIPDEQWRVVTGSGIWISPGSDENEIAGNIFEDIASHAVVLEGDRNRVETRSASDIVRDLGSGNRVDAAAAGASASEAEAPDALEVLRALSLDSLDGSLPVYYSPGYGDRARSMQEMYAAAQRFYEERLGRNLPAVLAVLSEEHWPALDWGPPYGMPWITYRAPVPVMVLPATTDRGVLASRFRSVIGDEGVRRRIEIIGFHELGHALVQQYLYPGELRTPPVRWFDELLATYMGQGYLWTTLPDGIAQLRRQTAMHGDFRPPAGSLAHFEVNYWDLVTDPDAPVYGWYQTQFALRAAEVFEARDIDFLRRLKDELPWERFDEWTSHELIGWLDRIEPGFAAWAAGLEGDPNIREGVR
jgi:parallel beta-helix repeat protein